MRFRQLDLNLLVALDALLTEKNVTRASERIHIGQPGMSAALSRLRDYFKDEILVPVGRKMELTPLAESLVEPLSEILESIDHRILSRSAFSPSAAKANFVFVMSDYWKIVLIPAFLARVQSLSPSMSFEITSLTDQVELAIERRIADFVIAPEDFLSPFHPREVLITDQYVVVAWRCNQLIGEGLTADHYFDLGHVVPRFGSGNLRGIDEAFLKRGRVARKVEVVVPDFAAIPDIIVGSHRIATLPKRFAEKVAARLPLKIFDLPFEMPPHAAFVQWNASKENDSAAQWVLQQLRETISAILSDQSSQRP